MSYLSLHTTANTQTIIPMIIDGTTMKIKRRGSSHKVLMTTCVGGRGKEEGRREGGEGERGEERGQREGTGEKDREE